MKYANLDNVTYHEADEIDHVTLRYRNGKGLDRTAAVAMIRYYAWRLPQLKELFSAPDPVLGDLTSLTDEELLARLYAARTYLLLEVFPDSALLKEQKKVFCRDK